VNFASTTAAIAAAPAISRKSRTFPITGSYAEPRGLRNHVKTQDRSPAPHQNRLFDGTKPLCRLDETAVQQTAAIGTCVLTSMRDQMIIRRDWTPTKDAILQQGALTGQTVGEIARKVNRTLSAVLTRAYSRRLKLRRSRSKNLPTPALMT
jgi:hypothetical protein